MKIDITAPTSDATNTSVILTRSSGDLPTRVAPDSGYYDSVNYFGEQHLRAALPISWYVQDGWVGPISETCRYPDLIGLCGKTQQLLEVEDGLYAEARRAAERILLAVEKVLESPLLLDETSAEVVHIIAGLVDFGQEPPEQFSPEWLVKSAEKVLQDLHRKIRLTTLERDMRLAALHRQKFSLVLARLLSREALKIAESGIDVSEDFEGVTADMLTQQLHAFSVDPLQVLWPQPIGGKPILTGWAGLATEISENDLAAAE